MLELEVVQELLQQVTVAWLLEGMLEMVQELLQQELLQVTVVLLLEGMLELDVLLMAYSQV